MDTFLVGLFWLTLLAALIGGFVAPQGALRWSCIGFVAVSGLWVAAANASVLVRGQGSMVPIVGGLLLTLAVAAVPYASVRWWAGVGLILDPWLPLVLHSLAFSKRKSEPEA